MIKVAQILFRASDHRHQAACYIDLSEDFLRDLEISANSQKSNVYGPSALSSTNLIYLPEKI